MATAGVTTRPAPRLPKETIKVSQFIVAAGLDGRNRANELFDAALAYACRHWSIIPTIGKKPAGLWRPFQNRAPDEATLRRLFAKPGITGLAVITGQVSAGLAVRDFDKSDAYHEWAEAYPHDARTLPTVQTARGFHVYAHLQEEAFTKFDDGELRADSGHYVLLPPSLHPYGSQYRWLKPLPPVGLPLPPLPSSLVDPREQGRHREDEPDESSKSSRFRQTQHNQTFIAWWTSAVMATLPDGPGQRNRCIFELARAVKSIKPDASKAELRAVLREWHQLALPFIRTKEFDESYSDFAIAWDRVRRPAGKFFAAAAAADCVLPQAVARRGYDGNLRRLAALCWQLQQHWGDHQFPLGCEIAGKFLGVSARHAARLIKALQFDEVLHLAAKEDKSEGKAREWRFRPW
jgi:hypothetical protein